MYCFGITHHNPTQVLSFLGKSKFIESRRQVLILSGNDLLPNKINHKAIFLLDSLAISRNAKLLNDEKYKGLMVFMFASALRLGEISGCELIDSIRSDDPMSPTSTPVSLRVRRMRGAMRKPATLTREPIDYLEGMVDHVKKGSLLNPLMSFIYSLPSATHQTPVKEACARYLLSSQTYESVIRYLDREVGLSLSRLAQQRMRVILESDAAAKYKALFSEYRSGITDAQLEALCLKHSTSAYEVRYLLSVCNDRPKSRTKQKAKGKR